MDKIWYRNPSKSEVIGRCDGDEKPEWPRIPDKSRTLKKIKKYKKIHMFDTYWGFILAKFNICVDAFFLIWLRDCIIRFCHDLLASMIARLADSTHSSPVINQPWKWSWISEEWMDTRFFCCHDMQQVEGIYTTMVAWLSTTNTTSSFLA